MVGLKFEMDRLKFEMDRILISFENVIIWLTLIENGKNWTVTKILSPYWSSILNAC